jgi:AcrR family transcriptional regulator
MADVLPVPAHADTPTELRKHTHEAASYADAAIHRGLSRRYATAGRDVVNLIDAAYRLIERGGVVEVKIRELLAEAGMATQQFYRYFASKDDFFMVLLEDGHHRLRSYLEYRVAQHVDPRDRIQACLDGFLAQAEDSDASSKTRPFVVHKARLNQERNRLHTMGSDVVDLLGREIKAARVALGTPSGDAESDARWLHALIMAVMEEHIIAATTPTAEEKESLFAFCFKALGMSR